MLGHIAEVVVYHVRPYSVVLQIVGQVEMQFVHVILHFRHLTNLFVASISEEKAKLLRQVTAKIAEKNQELRYGLNLYITSNDLGMAEAQVCRYLSQILPFAVMLSAGRERRHLALKYCSRL